MSDSATHINADENRLPPIGIVIPTLNAGEQIDKCLGPIVNGPHAGNYKVLVIDSSSTDQTIERVKAMGVAFEVIERSQFDHGLTRNYGRKKLGTPFVVCLTQDAFPTDADTIERLVAPLRAGSAQAAYGRQVPRPHSDLFEAYPRTFSYGPESFEKSWNDRAEFQLRLYMCSNSFAAYNNSALDSVGGFPKTHFGEDFLAAMAIVKAGGKIAYRADAVVEHSHPYELRAEAKRNFQIGVLHSTRPDIFEGLPKRDGSGALFARGLLRQAFKQTGIWGWTRGFGYLALRYISYRLGRFAGKFPPKLASLAAISLLYI